MPMEHDELADPKIHCAVYYFDHRIRVRLSLNYFAPPVAVLCYCEYFDLSDFCTDGEKTI